MLYVAVAGETQQLLLEEADDWATVGINQRATNEMRDEKLERVCICARVWMPEEKVS